MQENRDPLATRVISQGHHQPRLFLIGEIPDSPARLTEHPNLRHRISLGLAVANGHVEDTSEEGKLAVNSRWFDRFEALGADALQAGSGDLVQNAPRGSTSILGASSFMVNTAVSKPGLDLFSLREMGALWAALVRQLGGDP